MENYSLNLNVQDARIVSETLSDKTLEIILPSHKEDLTLISIDIGGSLTKVVYITKDSNGGSRINFKHFETIDIDQCITFLSSLIKQYNESCGREKSAIHIMATGGGAFKHYNLFQTGLNAEIVRQDEMECLVAGLDFLITKIPNEMYIYSGSESVTFCQPESNIYPCLVFQRIGGSSIGGGTLWGLISILTNVKTFDGIGDNTAVDTLVGDIYGTDYSKIGLDSSIVASAFAKVFQKKMNQKYETLNDFQSGFSQEDIIKRHPLMMDIFSRVLYFWSGGTKKAYFLRHEGYLGALGAFLKYHPPN
ncbi:hypothetical protein PCANB_000853 [Pneumocystis canis]|nr:hypothetical protein PCANB_000853 [Pneumocystis canis]